MAVTVRGPDGAEQVLVVDLVTLAIEPLPHGEADPAWGPGGRLVTVRAGGDGAPTLVLREPGRRAREVWAAPGAIAATAVLADGAAVAVAAWPSAPPGATPAVSHATRQRVHKRDGSGFVGALRPVLHLVDVAGGTARRIDVGPRGAVEALVPSPDGGRLAVRVRGDDLYEEVVVVEVATGAVTPMPVGPASVLGGLSWLDEQRALAALDSEGSWHPSDLAVLGPNGPQVVVRDAELAVLGADRDVVWGARRGRAVVLALDPERGRLVERAALPVGARALAHDAGSGRTAAIAGPARGPLELLCAEPGRPFEAIDLGAPRARRSRTTIPAPEILTVGRVECLVARPTHPAARFVVDLHGGPFGCWGGEHDPLHAALLDAGFAVVTPNVTGSVSYGRAHAGAIVGAWGEVDRDEVLAVADAAAAQLGCDPARAGVAGYSYGGYLAAMLVATSDRFAAAVCAAPVWDLRSSLGTGDEADASFGLNSLGLAGHDLLDRADRHSPARRLGLPTTPTLLMAGEADVSCPLSQSEQALFDLSWLGCEVELVRYPGQSHATLWDGPPEVVADRVARSVAWLSARV
jgi:dipeptidyl aminopeptidase/acylaminoacyl peptidase